MRQTSTIATKLSAIIVHSKYTAFIAVAMSCLFMVAPQSPSSVKADDKSAKPDDKPVKSADPGDAPLYPLKKGLKWEYTEKKEKIADEVTDITMWNKQLCYEISRKVDGKDSKYRRYIAVTDDGWSEAGVKTDKRDVISVPAQCFLKPPSKKLQTWTVTPRISLPSGEDALSLCDYKYSQYGDTISYEGKEVEAILVVCITSLRLEGSMQFDTKTHTWYLPGKGPVKVAEYEKKGGTGADKDDWVAKGDERDITFSSKGFINIGDIIINETALEKETSSESVEALPGVVTEFKKSRTITREISYTTKIGIGTEAELKLGADLRVVKSELTARIKGSIEKELGEKLSDSETREQTVKIDGDKIQKAKIVWIDTYRTGTVEVTQDGKPYKIPFQFPIGTKLVVRKQ